MKEQRSRTVDKNALTHKGPCDREMIRRCAEERQIDAYLHIIEGWFKTLFKIFNQNISYTSLYHI